MFGAPPNLKTGLRAWW